MQVTTEIYQAAVFSFDYLCLVIVASVLAGIGLATNNTVSRVCMSIRWVCLTVSTNTEFEREGKKGSRRVR